MTPEEALAASPRTKAGRDLLENPPVWGYDYELDIDALRKRADLAAGYPARWWVCPRCLASHRRGHFLTIGVHRCLRCGYVGGAGTMHINDPRPALRAALEEAER